MTSTILASPTAWRIQTRALCGLSSRSHGRGGGRAQIIREKAPPEPPRRRAWNAISDILNRNGPGSERKSHGSLHHPDR